VNGEEIQTPIFRETSIKQSRFRFACFAWFAVNSNREIRQPREQKNPKGISAFSPALPAEGGLRWVTKQNGHYPERVESIGANGDATLSGLEYVAGR
jgi:hypothetical protein